MTKKADEIKRKIIAVAIVIIQEEQHIDSVSIRRIAKRAGIGIGLINYHFQTKDNLIKTAVQQFIGTVIAQWDTVVPRKKLSSPKEHLMMMLQATAEFMAMYPRISKISILNDLLNLGDDDNTTQTLEGMMPILKEAAGNAAALQILVKRSLHALGCLQWIFLRNETMKSKTDFNFFDSDQRKTYITELVDYIFNKENQ